MSKEEYIEYRKTQNTGEIMYEFYKEGFQEEKHKPFLSREDFYSSIAQWVEGGQGHIFVPAVLSYYNSKFDIVQFFSKEGHLIKIV